MVIVELAATDEPEQLINSIGRLAAISEMPLWQEVDHAVLVAASKAIRKVMKDHGTVLTPPQTGRWHNFGCLMSKK
jgi:hypothetical protein